MKFGMIFYATNTTGPEDATEKYNWSKSNEQFEQVFRPKTTKPDKSAQKTDALYTFDYCNTFLR